MINQRPISDWLPITADEVKKRGWEELDIIIISGDAYVDHPSFGAAVIGRVLENEGYRVAILPQPNWQDDLRDFKKLGKPRLFFGITSGSMDSMVNHYTANKRLRSDDAYTPGGKAGFRPDYATVVYSNIVKQIFPDVPVIIGGVEASMRRFTHYDYWSDELKPSILIDSQADMLVYGMGEEAIIEIAKKLDHSVPINKINHVPQTAFVTDSIVGLDADKILLTSHQACLVDKLSYALDFVKIETEANKQKSKGFIQPVKNKYVVLNSPYESVNQKRLDAYYDLPYTRLPHPKYKKRGPIPAYEMIRHSINIHRGCFGGCSFCTITLHQGKKILSRTEESILKEVEEVVKMEDYKGYISDLGGPSANMYQMQGIDSSICISCIRASCIFPAICKNLNFDHRPLLNLYRKVEANSKVKKVFIGSGVRYDMLLPSNQVLSDKYALDEYMKQLIINHVSGRLKVAPEHTSQEVLDVMRKPSFELFKTFKAIFHKVCQENRLKYQLIPYFISSHPACSLEDMAHLAMETKKLNYTLEQVQDFTPTPMTLATVMYYTGVNPYTMKPVFVAKTKEQKQSQNKFFFWYKLENKAWIVQMLNKMHKEQWAKYLYGFAKNAENKNSNKENSKLKKRKY